MRARGGVLVLGSLFGTTALAQYVPAGDLVELPNSPGPGFPGIDFTYGDIFAPSEEEACGGSAVDWNNDGWIDLFVPGNKNQANKLYRNNGDGTFTDVAVTALIDAPAPAGSVGLFVDYDMDGDYDLILCGHLSAVQQGLPPLKLYRNSGASNGFQFFDVTNAANMKVDQTTTKKTLSGWVSGGCVGDFNADGFPDFFVSWSQGTLNNDQWRMFISNKNSTPGDPAIPTYTPYIYLDKTKGSGLDTVYTGEPWQPVAFDYDRDGYTDLYIAIDGHPDLLFHNNKNLTFTEVASLTGINGNPIEGRNEMGVALGDFDNDLDLDITCTNRDNKDRLYRNDWNGVSPQFVDVAQSNGTFTSYFGWGVQFADIDNDADLDRLAVTGFEHATTQPWWNDVHVNLFPQRTLDDATYDFFNAEQLFAQFTKFGDPLGDSSRGLTQFDYDNDGDVDFFMTRNHAKCSLFQNTLSSPNHWIELNLRGRRGSLHTTGTQIYAMAGGKIQYREVITGSSFLCQDSPRMHFGLGSESLNWVIVKWSGNQFQIVKNLPIDHISTITRSLENDAGDMNGDGHRNFFDVMMLQLLVADGAAYKAKYPTSPGFVTGDCDGDGVISFRDLLALIAMPQS